MSQDIRELYVTCHHRISGSRMSHATVGYQGVARHPVGYQGVVRHVPP